MGEETEKKAKQERLNAFLASYAVGISTYLLMVSRSPIESKLDGNILIMSSFSFASIPILLFIMFNKVKTK